MREYLLVFTTAFAVTYLLAVLARELALCYTALALVTDHDAGVEGDGGVTQEEVFRVFAENTERLRTLLLDVAAALPVAKKLSRKVSPT